MSKATTVMEMQMCEGFMENLVFAKLTTEGKKSTRIIPDVDHPINTMPRCFGGVLVVNNISVKDMETIINGQAKHINNAIEELNRKLFSLTGEAMQIANHTYQTIQTLKKAIDDAVFEQKLNEQTAAA